MSDRNRKDIRKIIFLFLLLIITGMIGYKYLLGVNVVDALYMTVITVSTVGYKEVADMNTPSKLFSIFMIFWGVGTVGYTLSTLVLMFVEGHFAHIWRDRKMRKKISDMENHYIICGGDSTGEVIVREFLRENVSFVLIDRDEGIYHRRTEENLPIILGNATDTDILLAAGVKRAKGLISALPSDVDNIVTVLSARTVNPDLYIISQAVEHGNISKLEGVGADKIISVNQIGGRRMAMLMTHPNIMSFLDVMTEVGGVEMDLEEVVIPEGSPFSALTLAQASIPTKTGLIVLAVRKKDSPKIHFNPGSHFLLEPGDVLIVLGRHDQVEDLNILTGASH